MASVGGVDYSNLTDEDIRQFQSQENAGPWQAGNYASLNTQAGNWINNFKSQFKDSVGRDPTQDEISLFQNNYIAPNAYNINERSTTQAQNPTSYISQFIGQNYQQAAQQQAAQRLSDQQTQWNNLAQTSLNAGNQAINSTQSALLGYQQKLFDRLRPNLITSLQAQGLLDTGGFNEAVAGVQGDLANNASNYIAQLQLQNQQQANNIALTGQAAPTQYLQGAYSGDPGMFANNTANAVGFNNNTFMSNLNYQQQLGLQNNMARLQEQMQPSFFRTFSQGLAGGLGSGLANNATTATNPSLFGSGRGGGMLEGFPMSGGGAMMGSAA